MHGRGTEPHLRKAETKPDNFAKIKTRVSEVCQKYHSGKKLVRASVVPWDDKVFWRKGFEGEDMKGKG